jgi:UDP-N-acetylglucosamine 3-dehydrogenase
MSGKIRVLILGAGAMARKHIEAYQRLPGVEVAAVANRSADRAQALCAAYGIPRCETDLTGAIAAIDAEIVSICLPTAMHPEMAIRALSQGRHVLTEKPIALSLEDAQEMISASRKAGKKLSVVFNRRFNAVFEECRRRLPRLGAPLIYNTQEIRSIRPKLAMHSRSGNGGPVIDCCVHDFDMLLHLFGKVKAVHASGHIFGGDKAFLRGIRDPAVDTAQINVEFANGNRAYLLYAWGFPSGQNYWQHREFMGPGGILRLLGEFGQEIHHYREDGLLETVAGLSENGHEVVARKFVEAVREGRDVPVAPEEAVEALRISLAALASIESGEIRRLDWKEEPEREGF